MTVLKRLNNITFQDDPLLLANDLVMWALTASNGCYDARTRYCIRHITWKLHIKYEEIENVEEMLIQMLRENTDKENAYVDQFFPLAYG